MLATLTIHNAIADDCEVPLPCLGNTLPDNANDWRCLWESEIGSTSCNANASSIPWVAHLCMYL